MEYAVMSMEDYLVSVIKLHRLTRHSSQNGTVKIIVQILNHVLDAAINILGLKQNPVVIFIQVQILAPLDGKTLTKIEMLTIL